jgi:hypothetical protein
MSKKLATPRYYHDVPKVEPTISKQPIVPKFAGGLPKPEKRNAVLPQYKCVDCGGYRVYGVGNRAKPKNPCTYDGETTHFFCYCCGKLLRKAHRKADMEKMKIEMFDNAEQAIGEQE